jgi:diamine N-acetyltransferase
MPSFSIRLGNVEDIADIICVQEHTWESTYTEILSKEQIDYMFGKIYSRTALEEQMTTGGQSFLLLLKNLEIEGFASVSQEDDGVWKMQKLYVLPSTQGAGAGKFLLNAVEKFVLEKGGTTLTLNVNRYNKARHFYEKMGFVIVKEVDIPIGIYWMNDFVLSKPL